MIFLLISFESGEAPSGAREVLTPLGDVLTPSREEEVVVRSISFHGMMSGGRTDSSKDG